MMMAKLIHFTRKPAFLSLMVMGVRASTLGVKFLLTLFIARFMSLEDVGMYGLIAAITIMAPPMLGGGFMVITSRMAVTCSKEQLTQALRQYARFIFVLYVCLCAVAAVYALMQGNITLVMLVVAVVLLEHVNQDFYVLLLNLSRPLAANLLHFSRAALWAVMFMGGAYVLPEYRTMQVLMSFWLVGNIICFIGFVLIARHWPWRSNEKLEPLNLWMRLTFIESRTLYVNEFIQTVGTYLDRFIISLFIGLEMTGVYVLFLSVSTALSNLVLTGIIQFARPRMVRAYKEKNSIYADIYRKCVKDTVFSCVVLGVIAAGIMYVLVPYLGRPLLLEWLHVLWLVLISFMAVSLIYAQNLVFYSQHRDSLTLRYNMVFTAFMFTLNLLLIPFLGIVGAAITAIIAPTIIIILQYRRIKCSHLLNLP